MSSMLDKIRSMRQQTQQKETKLITGTKTWGSFMGVNDLEEGKTTIRVVKHPDDPIPFFPFRSTWLEVEESLSTLSRYQLNNIVKEKKLERVLGIRKTEDLEAIEDDKLRELLVDELGSDYKKSVNKRVFISKIHGNPEIPDVIEEYIKFASQMAKGVSQDYEEQKRKMNPIRGYRDKTGKWNPGIMPSTSFVAYIYEWDNSDRQIKRLEIWEKHMNEIEKLYASFDDPDEPLTIDPFSDSKEGVAIVVDKSKNEKGKWEYSFSDKKNISRTGSFRDFVKQFALTEDMKKELSDCQPLTEIYTNVYGRRDFELALSGLQIFDEKNRMGVFDHDEFLDILENIAKYYDGTPEEKKPEPKREQKVEKEVEPKPVFKREPEPEKIDEPEVSQEESLSPYGNSIEELKEYIKENNLGIRVWRTHTFDDVVASIEEAEAELAKEKTEAVEPTEPDYSPNEEEEDNNFSAEEATTKPSLNIDDLRARLRAGKK